MALQTVNELRSHALFLAGEPTSANTSDWYTQVITYLDEVYRAVLAGGSVGKVPIEAEDWQWALKKPRGRLRILPAFNPARTVTFTFTKDSTTVTVDSMTSGLSVADYHLIVPSSVSGSTEGAFVTTVSAHTASATTMTLTDAWPYASTTGTDPICAPLEYALPTDFLRFVSPIFPLLDSGEDPIEVVGAGALAQEWPIAELVEGVASHAAIVGMDSSQVQYLRFSHFVRDPYDVEFDYIYRPTALVAGTGTPAVPEHHRRVLALGAAYLIALDKQNKRSEELEGQFLVAFNTMVQEHKTNTTAGTDQPLILPRRGGRDPRRLLRTTSGSIIG